MAKKRAARKPPTPVTGSEFRLVDARGKTRARLSMLDYRSGKSSPSLRFMDEDQYERIVIELAQDGNPLVALLDQAGHTVVGLGLSEDGSGLSISDLEGNFGLLVRMFPDGSRVVIGLDQSGKTVWEKQWK